MIDLHSHILPGIDDGARSLETSLDMARSAVEDGIGALAATPHVRSDYPTKPKHMERLVASTIEALAEASIPLELLRGGEIALDALPGLKDESLRRFGLGGNPRYLLLEMPNFGWPLDLEQTLFDLRLRDFTAVLAHPERNLDVQERPELVERLVATGSLVQITAASVDGRLGSAPRKAATRLLELGLVHMLASDAHAPTVRQIGMSAAVKALGDPELAAWLTDGVPRAIVEGSVIPERPGPPRRGFRGRRFRGGR